MKYKKILFFMVVGVIVAISSFVIITEAIPRWNRGMTSRQYIKAYCEDAINYVMTETDVVKTMRKDVKIRSNSCAYTYSPEYANLPAKSRTPNSREEFDQMIQKLSVWVEIDRTDKIVVVYEKDQQGKLAIVDWYWEK